jgi:hypothetical protein
MAKKFILLEYDPDDCIQGKKDVDLFELIHKAMNKFDVKAYVMDYREKDPRK